MKENDRGHTDRAEALYFRSPRMATLAGTRRSQLIPPSA